MTFIDWLTSTIGTAAVLTALVAAFWKIIMNRVTASVKSRYDKELETHIDTLRHKTELALKDFEAKANERSIILTTVVEKRANAILGIHKTIYQMQESMNQYGTSKYSTSITDRQNALSELGDKFRRFTSCVEENRILLPRPTSDKIAKLKLLFVNQFGAHMMRGAWKADAESENSQFSFEEKQEFRKEIAKIETEFKAVQEQLESDFQKLLGVSVKDLLDE